jgi:uncharacterized protein YceK
MKKLLIALMFLVHLTGCSTDSYQSPYYDY